MVVRTLDYRKQILDELFMSGSSRDLHLPQRWFNMRRRKSRSEFYQSSLSLLVLNLFSTSSKAPVSMRAPPEKG